MPCRTQRTFETGRILRRRQPRDIHVMTNIFRNPIRAHGGGIPGAAQSVSGGQRRRLIDRSNNQSGRPPV